MLKSNKIESSGKACGVLPKQVLDQTGIGITTEKVSESSHLVDCEGEVK